MSKKVDAAIEKAGQRILDKRNVVGLGEAEKEKDGRKTGKKGLTVYVEAKVAKNRIQEQDLIPKIVEGVRTDVVVLERSEALPLHEGFEDRFDGWRRPFMMGDEIGPTYHLQCGTIGMISRIPFVGWTAQDIGLTNWHVLHSPFTEQIDILDHHVSQPGWPKHGQPAPEFIGKVFAHSTLDPTTPYNKVDAAFFTLEKPGGNPRKPAPGWNAPGSFWDGQIDAITQRGYLKDAGGAHLLGWPHYHANFAALIRDINAPGGFRPQPLGLGTVEIGDRVWKSGRTTGVTTGTVMATNYNCGVSYGGKLGIVRFTKQLMVRRDDDFNDPEVIVSPGDSGSGVFDETGNLVGLLFAGGKKHYIANVIQTVFLEVLEGIDEVFNLNREATS
ncbi:hypothetical protein HN911_14610 [Candidatus Bathyarchaeota archaeon]|jgi:hypothetical protein|nr:hypothetical protein [Candidatus Bathyarchaeota archaeon]